MTDRKLATIQRVESLTPIPDADKIELLQMEGLGWQCVVQKGIHTVGDLVVYHEIDSFLDIKRPQYAWLGKQAIKWNGHEGARIKTIRLRGQLSQGVIIPLREFYEDEGAPFILIHSLVPPNKLQRIEMISANEAALNPEQIPVEPGTDLTEWLGVLKWERPQPGEGSASRGTFPYHTPKTDEERFQNLIGVLARRESNFPLEYFEETEKLEGSSMTVYLDKDGNFGVCSRNQDYASVFWRVAKKLNLEEQMRSISARVTAGELPYPPAPVAFSLQGELIGPGIQGNHYKLTEHQFRLFNIYDINRQRRLTPEERRLVTGLIDGLMHAPYLGVVRLNELGDKDAILARADGPSMINHEVPREGVVYKSVDDPSFSFKVVSNAYLLKTES